MTDPEDPEAVIARLREAVAVTRRQRMNAQKAAIAAPVLEVALNRAARDRSSRATNETDAIREEIADLWDQIFQEARQVDRVRELFARADAVYPRLSPRPRLVAELNEEARWRASFLKEDQAIALRLELPHVEECV
jgi:hypothetical protein